MAVQLKNTIKLTNGMLDSYEELSDEELKEIFEDIEADYWIDYNKSNPE